MLQSSISSSFVVTLGFLTTSLLSKSFSNDVCQHNKEETVKALGTIQPLPIPPAIWRDISMDFIVGLPKLGNKSVIMVVVDCLSKYAHFCALQHPFTTSIMDQIFMHHVFKVHGIPHSIVSDRDPSFMKNFWK